MHNTKAYITQQSSHLLVVYTVLTNEEMTTESQRYNCFIRNGGNAIPKQAGPEAKCSNPTTGLTLLWARNTFRGKFLTTGKSHGKKTDRFTLKDDKDANKVLRFKYATWNIEG